MFQFFFNAISYLIHIHIHSRKIGKRKVPTHFILDYIPSAYIHSINSYFIFVYECKDYDFSQLSHIK